MKQLANICMLPTNKPSRIVKRDDICGLELYLRPARNLLDGWEYLYFTTNEEAKEGDWCVDVMGEQIFKMGEALKSYPIGHLRDSILNNAKKIVASTNPELWLKKPIKDAEGHFSNTPVPSIPESFLIAYIKAYNAGSPITKVMLEYGSITNSRKHLTEQYQIEFPKLNSDGSVIWSLKEERMYTRKEMFDAYGQGFEEGEGDMDWQGGARFDNWVNKTFP